MSNKTKPAEKTVKTKPPTQKQRIETLEQQVLRGAELNLVDTNHIASLQNQITSMAEICKILAERVVNQEKIIAYLPHKEIIHGITLMSIWCCFWGLILYVVGTEYGYDSYYFIGLACFFGLIFMLDLVVDIILPIKRWLCRRKEKKATLTVNASLSGVDDAVNALKNVANARAKKMSLRAKIEGAMAGALSYGGRNMLMGMSDPIAITREAPEIVEAFGNLYNSAVKGEPLQADQIEIAKNTLRLPEQELMSQDDIMRAQVININGFYELYRAGATIEQCASRTAGRRVK